MTDLSNISTAKSKLPNPPTRRKSPKQPGASTTAPLYNALQLTELVKILRELGVTKFQQGDLHLELAHVGPPLSKAEELPTVVAGPPQLGPTAQEISNEDMLFWSVDNLETPNPLGDPGDSDK